MEELKERSIPTMRHLKSMTQRKTTRPALASDSCGDCKGLDSMTCTSCQGCDWNSTKDRCESMD